MRKIKFAENELYHIYNRGVDKRQIFQDDHDYQRFYEAVILLNDDKDGLMAQWKDFKRFNTRAKLWELPELSSRRKKLVEIVAYCFNPNHYHFILKQIADEGIKRFMHKLGTSHTNYFNQKYDRSGSLFQGPFKSSQIKANALIYLSAYVNCNSEIHGIAKAQSYRWCSFPDYLGKREKSIVKNKVVSNQFKNLKEYKNYVEEYIKHFQERKRDEKTFFE
jgi:putative transposase